MAKFKERNKKILIVEDDPDLRETLSLLLEPYYVVIVAEDGLSGLKLAHREVPDLVLLDLRMPKMDGFETCRLIRADKEFDSVSVVVLTGFVSEQDKLKAVESGADDFIGKPFEVSDLLQRIEERLVAQRPSQGEHNGTSHEALKFEGLVVYSADREATLGGKPLHLSNTEFAIVQLLVKQAENVVSREVLIKTVWHNQDVSPRIVDAHLVSIRHKLKSGGIRISSVYGQGYVLKGNA